MFIIHYLLHTVVLYIQLVVQLFPLALAGITIYTVREMYRNRKNENSIHQVK